MIGDHHSRTAGEATLLVRAVDEVFGTHTAQAHARPPQIDLAEHRVRRKQILGGLTHEYQIAA
jgi:hypothetical protein